jgi:fumarylacetoacetate (FAA) hydrolase
MKFISFINTHKKERLGLWHDSQVIDLQNAGKVLSLEIPSDINSFLEGGSLQMKNAQTVCNAAKEGKVAFEKPICFLAPVPHPPSCRDAYAFRQHVATARRNRGLDMIPEFDQFPIFYFTNHNAVFGEGEITLENDHFLKLDFELEAAIVIGKQGRNISAKDADHYIAGFTIMNDLSARQLQMEEMKLNLGPAKGKDFATVIGPWLVTPDELEPYKVPTPRGNTYDLPMKAFHNGKKVSEGNLKDMNFTFAEIIERCSYGADLFPGDVIGSGTVGTGCYLELNGTWALQAKEKGIDFTPTWLQSGDTMELEITGLGKLSSTVLKSKTDNSILAKKKIL